MRKKKATTLMYDSVTVHHTDVKSCVPHAISHCSGALQTRKLSVQPAVLPASQPSFRPSKQSARPTDVHPTSLATYFGSDGDNLSHGSTYRLSTSLTVASIRAYHFSGCVIPYGIPHPSEGKRQPRKDVKDSNRSATLL